MKFESNIEYRIETASCQGWLLSGTTRLSDGKRSLRAHLMTLFEPHCHHDVGGTDLTTGAGGGSALRLRHRMLLSFLKGGILPLGASGFGWLCACLVKVIF